jgi:hypothetical protein
MILRIAAAIAVSLTALLSPSLAAQATACTGAAPEDMAERFSTFSEFANVVVLAEITASADVPEGDTSFPGLDEKTATFEPVVVLKQDQPLEEFTIGPLRSSAPDCSGGPVMLAGERVLLFLSPQVQYEDVAAWRVGVFGDVVVFSGDSAEYAYGGDAEEQYREPAGTAAEVIGVISDVLGLDAATRDAAYAFVGAEAPAPAPSPAPAGPPAITPPDTGNAGLR